MDEPKTVGSDIIESTSDSLYVRQLEDVAKMRTSLLLCNTNDANSAKKALQNITVLRVYHQIARIIRFTEVLDRMEDKMYESIDNTLDSMDSYDPTTWSTLMRMQAQLQNTMIESQKLLDPYLKSEFFTAVQTTTAESDSSNQSFATMMLEPESRQKLRESAAAVLAALDSAEVQDD